MPYDYDTAAQRDAVARALVILSKRLRSIHHWPNLGQIMDLFAEMESQRKTLGRFEYFDAVFAVERALEEERCRIFRRQG